MANVIRLKRASGSDPAASDLVSGEPAVRTDTGELFFKKDDGSVAKVSGAGGGPDFKYLALRNAANNGAASYPNADFTLVTSGTTTALTPTAANTLLVSVNGVIQKPNTGTSTPSSGFALSGSTIKFGANISAAPDFILYQESGGIGEPSDDTVSEVKLKVSNSPVNGYFLSAQSGNTGGLTWAAPVATSCTGNSATATALATARAINGVNFDGTAAITVTAAAGTLTGTTLKSTVVTSSLTSLGDLGGLTVDGDATFTGANYNVLWDKSDNALEFADNAKARFGTGNDLEIFHDGNFSRIRDVGTGDLVLHSNTISFVNAADSETIAQFKQDGSVDLYYNHSKKFETTSTGIAVTGAITGTGDLTIDTNTLHVDSSNNRVGIGTASPQENLHILSSSGSSRIRMTSADGSDNMIVFGDTSDQATGAIKFDHSDNSLALFGFNNSERMRIDSSGNVLIGNTSSIGSSYRLQVYHATDARMYLANTTAASSQEVNLQFAPANSVTGALITCTSEEDFSTTANRTARLSFSTRKDGTLAEHMRIDSSGNVGIGTTSPSTKLHVNGTVTATAYAGDGSALTGITAGAQGGGGESIFFESENEMNNNYTISTNHNALIAGPLTIASGATLTINSPSVVTIP